MLYPLLYFPISQILCPSLFIFFFFNDTATTEIYTLSLHDALPILMVLPVLCEVDCRHPTAAELALDRVDRKSTRLNCSHSQISYAVFCLKKKKNRKQKEKHGRYDVAHHL